MTTATRQRVIRIIGYREFPTILFWRDLFAEFFCSMLMLLPLTFNYVTYSDTFTVNPTHAGVVMGFTVGALVETFGHISGGHMNPLVTWVMLWRGDISITRAFFYIIFQCGGAAAGSGVVYGFTPPEFRHRFKPFQPAPALGAERGLAVECVLSFIHMMIVQGVTDPFRKTACNIPGIPIGFSIALNVMIGFTYTGGAFNPIIAFGPAVISRNFHLHWIYWLGDFAGASVAVIVMNSLRYAGRKTEVKEVSLELDPVKPVSYVPNGCEQVHTLNSNSITQQEQMH